MVAPFDDATTRWDAPAGEKVADDAAKVRTALEVDRLSRELADRFHVARDAIESRVQDEFGRWSSVPIQDFVPIFVERAIRGRIRSHSI